MKSYFSKVAFALIFANLAATSVCAATTPQQYCASLGSPSCELLNYEAGGLAFITNSGLAHGASVIKYCKNGIFKIVPAINVVTTAPSAYLYYVSSFGVIGVSNADAVFSNSICSNLP